MGKKRSSDGPTHTERGIGRRAASGKPVPRDVALLGGPTQDGQGAHMLRVKDGQVTAGELRPAREGQPLQQGGELVRLQPLHPELPICEVETLYAATEAGAQDTRKRGGPARVSNDTYRKNWNAVFGGKRTRKRAKDADPDYSLN